MPLPSINDVHVDSLRTEMSIAYVQQPNRFVADKIFPLLRVDKQSDKYAVWSKADFMRRQMRKIGDSDPAPEMSFGVDTSNTFYCHTYGGKKFLSDRGKANYDTPLNADRATVNFVTQQALIERDARVAAAVWTTGIWGTDSTPGTLWSAGSSDPIGDMRTGIRTVATNTGYRPNTLTLGADTWDILQDHSDLLDRIKHTQTGVVTEDLLANILKLDKVVVAEATYNSASAGATATMTELFGAKHALLTYSASAPSHDEPSAGYTFSWSEFDNVTGGDSVSMAGAAAIKTWREDDPDGEYFRAMMSFDPKVTASDCGYFFNGAVA